MNFYFIFFRSGPGIEPVRVGSYIGLEDGSRPMEVGSYIGSEDGARPKVVGSIPTWVIRFGQATIWDVSLRGLI